MDALADALRPAGVDVKLTQGCAHGPQGPLHGGELHGRQPVVIPDRTPAGLPAAEHDSVLHVRDLRAGHMWT